MANSYCGLMYAASVDAETISALARDGVDAHAESIGYHAQQLAEKMVKAAFESKEVDFPFTHNIRLLLKKAEQEELLGEPSEETIESALYLSSLISVTRYAEAPDFQEGEARRAVAASNAIAAFLEESGYDAIKVELGDESALEKE